MFGYGNQQGGYNNQQGGSNRPQRGGGGISPGLLVFIGVVLLIILSRTGAIDGSVVTKILVGVAVAYFVIPTFLGGAPKNRGGGQQGQQGGYNNQQGINNRNNRW